MQSSAIPTKFPVPFAVDATGSFIRAVPVTQSVAGNGSACLDLGFPPETFTPPGAGGYAPDGRDFNGLLNQISAWCQWFSAGGAVPYDATFQTAIGGYPKGAIVESAVTPGTFWLSTAENNTTNPDSSGAGWSAWPTPAQWIAGDVSTLDASLGLSGGTLTAKDPSSYASLFVTPGPAVNVGVSRNWTTANYSTSGFCDIGFAAPLSTANYVILLGGSMSGLAAINRATSGFRITGLPTSGTFDFSYSTNGGT